MSRKLTWNLLPLLAFATPHVAGYGLEGKARGTTMVLQQLLPVPWPRQGSECFKLACLLLPCRR